MIAAVRLSFANETARELTDVPVSLRLMHCSKKAGLDLDPILGPSFPYPASDARLIESC